MIKTNIIDFLDKYRVEIPMLQRDYAQGRISQKTIVVDFIKEILNVLSGRKKNLHIDFIYGYTENGKFILIDGQQRITTLWLITVYFYKIFGKVDEIKKIVSNFSYNTRSSAKSFCKKLIKEYNLNIEKKPKEQIYENPIVDIKELNNDPTIKSMLNTLDIIYSMYINEYNENINYNNIASNISNITFSLFNMGEYSLGEELYIKMNARGKQLSLYENVKAYIEEDIRDEHEILVNIDREWSDFFFNITSKELFDTRAYICISTIATFLHYNDATKSYKWSTFSDLRSKINSKNIDKEFFDILKIKDNINLITIFIDLVQKQGYLECLELLKIEKYCFTAKIFEKELGYIELSFFYALLFYVKKLAQLNNFNTEDNIFDGKLFIDYYRVCKHIILNDRLDEDVALYNVIKKLELISCGLEEVKLLHYNDFYQYIAHQESKDKIMGCEILKAKLILESRNGGDAWEDTLKRFSDDPFYIGWVDFIINYSYIDGRYNYTQFDKYAKLCLKLSQYIFCNDDKINFRMLQLFLRAMMSIGDYGFYSTNWFYGNIIRLNIFRDREAWIWILSGSKDGEESNKIFQNLLDELLERKLDISEDAFESIINSQSYETREWWEQALILQNELWEKDILLKAESYQRSGRIRFTENEDGIINKAELLPTIKNRMRAKDLFTYSFYIFLQSKKGFELSEYIDQEQRGYETDFLPSFSINEEDVICDSINGMIYIGDDEFEIDLTDGSLFNNYKKIIKQYKDKYN